MEIIDKLSIENNLSNSKIISILVEEALSKRGIFNKKNGKATKSNVDIQDYAIDISEDKTNFKYNQKMIINSKIKNNKNPVKTRLAKQTNQEDFDLQTYKKFLSFLKFQEMMDEYNK